MLGEFIKKTITGQKSTHFLRILHTLRNQQVTKTLSITPLE